ncbi:MAG: AbrB/MazE/SpoVT family DNA-binding domain-containing protein [Candidatus Margulisiibacteriota bacterium]
MKNINIEDRLYDMVTVGERGQIVIPAKARRDFKIAVGDKLMVVRGFDDVGLVLIKSKSMAEVLNRIVKSLGKIHKNIKRKENK